MSMDEMPCGCLGHADNEHLCRYPALEEEVQRLKFELAEWERMRDQDHEMGRNWTPERGCGDNSCAFRTERKGGMSTNGGCRCHENPQVARRVFRMLREQIAELKRDHP